MVKRRWFNSEARTVAVSSLLGLALQVQAESPPDSTLVRNDREVSTIRGHLEIRRVERPSVLREFQFTLDGKEVGTDEGYGSVSILASYPEKGPARVVLLELLTGGSGCPGFFKVLEIKEEGGVLLSEEFGNCAPVARSSFTNGTLRIDIPKIGGAPAESWRYQNGKLSRSKRAPSK